MAEVIRVTPGIASVFTRSEILYGRLPETEVASKVRAAYNAARSPDVYLVAHTYWLDGTATASHGTPYAYDSHVPLVFYGAGLEPMEVFRLVEMTDIAPTLTSLLGIALPSASIGTPLEEITRGARSRPSLTVRTRRF